MDKLIKEMLRLSTLRSCDTPSKGKPNEDCVVRRHSSSLPVQYMLLKMGSTATVIGLCPCLSF